MHFLRLQPGWTLHIVLSGKRQCYNKGVCSLAANTASSHASKICSFGQLTSKCARVTVKLRKHPPIGPLVFCEDPQVSCGKVLGVEGVIFGCKRGLTLRPLFRLPTLPSLCTVVLLRKKANAIRRWIRWNVGIIVWNWNVYEDLMVCVSKPTNSWIWHWSLLAISYSCFTVLRVIPK